MKTRPTAWSRVLGALALLLAATAPGLASAAACTARCLAPGDYSLSMTWDGVQRSYLLHVPASYTGADAVPLLIDAHGSGETDTDQRGRSGQLAQSDARGFIVAWPQGVLNSWNAYGCCSAAYYTQVDDVGFIRALISTLETQANVDASRVFMTGWSNGGGLTQRMACEAADVIRAAASVSYPMNTTQCHPTRPITVVEFAGTADLLVNYYGLDPMFQAAPRSLASWRIVDGCTTALTTTPLAGGSTDQTYAECSGGVRAGLVTVRDGMHDLYPSTPTNNVINGHGPSGVDVADYIWKNVFVKP